MFVFSCRDDYVGKQLMPEARTRPVSPRGPRRFLRRHRYFRGIRDLDQTRDLVARMYCSHDMDLAERGPLDAWMNVVAGRQMLYSSMGYGAASVVRPGRTESFFPVMIPRSGGGTVQVGRERVTISTDMAAVVSASEPLSMRLSEDCTLVIACIDRDSLERQATEMVGEPISEPLRFTLGMDLTQGPAARWYRQLLDDMDDLDSPDSLLLSHDLSAYHAERRLMASLLLAQPHNYSHRLEAGRVIRTPVRLVRVVKELIDEHPELPHSRKSLAEYAYCSTRALDAAFKRHTGVTPMAYLHEHRLLRARELLTIAGPVVDTVSRIAGKCGFTHLGRFAGDYRQRFGEWPSTTLRRC